MLDMRCLVCGNDRLNNSDGNRNSLRFRLIQKIICTCLGLRFNEYPSLLYKSFLFFNNGFGNRLYHINLRHSIIFQKFLNLLLILFINNHIFIRHGLQHNATKLRNKTRDFICIFFGKRTVVNLLQRSMSAIRAKYSVLGQVIHNIFFYHIKKISGLGQSGI